MRNAIAFFLLLAACDRGPEVPTAAENRDLNSAAAMLDEADNGLGGIDENGLGSDSRPEP